MYIYDNVNLWMDMWECLWRRKMGWELISFVQTKGNTFPADFFQFCPPVTKVWFRTPCLPVFILGFSTVAVYQVWQLPTSQNFSYFIWLGYCGSKPRLWVCQRWIKKVKVTFGVCDKWEILNIPNIQFTLNEICCPFYFYYETPVKCWFGVFWLVYEAHFEFE